MYLEGTGELTPRESGVNHILDMQNNSGSSNTPPERIERYPDYSRISSDQAREKEYEYLQEMTKQSNYKNEFMSIIDDKKNVLGTWKGDCTLNADSDMKNILETSLRKTLSLLHTHLDNKISFTKTDLISLVKYESIKDISIKYPDGRMSYITIGNENRPAIHDFTDWLHDKSLEILKSPYYNNIKYDDVRWSTFYFERNNEIRRHYGWILR